MFLQHWELSATSGLKMVMALADFPPHFVAYGGGGGGSDLESSNLQAEVSDICQIRGGKTPETRGGGVGGGGGQSSVLVFPVTLCNVDHNCGHTMSIQCPPRGKGSDWCGITGSQWSSWMGGRLNCWLSAVEFDCFSWTGSRIHQPLLPQTPELLLSQNLPQTRSSH